MDFATAIVAMNADRLKVVDFMTSFWEESLAFVVKQPKPEYLTLYTNPFHVSEGNFYTIVRASEAQHLTLKRTGLIR